MKLGRIMFAPDEGAGSSSGSGTPPPATTSILNTPPPVSTPAAAEGGVPPTTPPAPSSVSFKELIGDDGGLKENWISVLPKELQADPSFKNIKTFEALAKSYSAAQKLVGLEKVALPGKNSTKEEREAFFNKIGRPETAEGYKFVKPESIPADKWDDTRVKAFAVKAHEIGITQAQFEQLINYDTELKLQGWKQSDKMKVQVQNECVEELRKEWGGAYQQELGKAYRVATTFGSLAELEEMGVADNPKFLKLLAKIGGAISEDRIRGADSMLVPMDAMSKIKEIQGDKTHPYNVKDHPSHEIAVKDMERLFAQAYPEPKK